MGSRLRDLLASRRRVLIAAAVLFLLLATWRARESADEGSLGASVAAAFERKGIRVDPESVLAVGPAGAGVLARQPLLAVGRPSPQEPTDLYYAEVRADEDGTVVALGRVRNLTETWSAAELAPVRAGPHVLYPTRVGDVYDAVVVLDLRGEPPALTAGWPLRARVQNAITNLHDTGRFEGLGRRRYRLRPPARDLTLEAQGGRFVLGVDGQRVVIDPRRVVPVEGSDRVEVRPAEKGQPGLITWAVDTVRNLSFVGPEPIAWLEHRVFGVKDWVERTWYGVAGTATEEETEAEVAEELGVTVEESRRRLALSATDPEIDWPPAPLAPVLGPEHGQVRGEGEWLPIVEDPFVASYPNAPPAFYQTFLRVDPERLYVRVYLVVWDPRQAQLRIMTGTREPESTTGETGPGMVPRDPRVLERLVAAFNGGFQATHGEFGMMSDGHVYLPPKPWAATVGVYDDGRVAMGSWLPPPEDVRTYEEDWAIEQIPEGMMEFRQNLTSVVEDGTYNPWHRWYWGAAPLHAENQTYIDRSGLCLTEEGFFIYFWGRSMGPEQLGAAMNAARCVRGMHLDMNLPHTGFEFYDVRPKDEPHPPLERKLTDDQFEGPVPHTKDQYVARARKAVRSMAPMRFPRYLSRDARDFFYLALTPILPGPDLPLDPRRPGEGRFSTGGLPHAGWPHAFARAFLGATEGERTWLVRIDPRRVRPGPLSGQDSTGPALAFLTDAAELQRAGLDFALYAERADVTWQYGLGPPPPQARIVLSGKPVGPASDAGAAVAVDRDGFLLYVERQPDDPSSLAERLAQAGVERAMALPEGARLAFVLDGHSMGPDAYERPVDPAQAMPLFAVERPPRGEVLFPEVEPRPYGVWARLQDSRVRYFKPEDRDPRFVRPADGGVEAPEE